MPVEKFVDNSEPSNLEAVIWRYISFWKLRDLVETGQMYFRRADKFSDDFEGLPPEGYEEILGLDRYDIHDQQQRAHHIGYLAQIRQSFFVSCWHLHTNESIDMWRRYGNDGVAIVSRYSLLKSALDQLADKILVGQVRYGSNHLTGWNVIRFMTTKREEFSPEREVRAMIWLTKVNDGLSRHIGPDSRAYDRPVYDPPEDLPEGIKRPIDVSRLIAEVVISPFAQDGRLAEVRRLLMSAHLGATVNESELKSMSIILPNEEDLRRYS